jgi:hypothetical protein
LGKNIADCGSFSATRPEELTGIRKQLNASIGIDAIKAAKPPQLLKL